MKFACTPLHGCRWRKLHRADEQRHELSVYSLNTGPNAVATSRLGLGISS
ncbi:hypothetical protein WN51_01456 [Melipona quadrifasciata]|uniref:Uncharacterized protein n=1 Tax=Melipona quadrifasciata TaxID=166423 RepID=A0A0M8ZWI0_9HYME|nr:hypothetical protein WN51_01456 [Melipona quadrifasciata]